VTAGVVGASVGGGGFNGLINFPSGSTPLAGDSTNWVTDWFGTVGGGLRNHAGNGDATLDNAKYATVGGGLDNTASSDFATVGGGSTNRASYQYATVGGGGNNTASNNSATVSGGSSNTASGLAATVSGGNHNTALGDFSFAAGRRAKANHNGVFVWADSADADFASTAASQFLIRASGGVGIGMNAPSAQLHVNGADNNGANATLKITSGGQTMLLDGNEIDAMDDVLYLNHNSTFNVVLADGGGNVGIGTGFATLSQKLHVLGNIRVGTSGTNGCVQRFDGTALTGTCSSDMRFKRDITPFANVLDRFVRLQPVHYYWRAAQFPQKQFGATQSYGLIAQDVAAVLPELVSEDEQGYKLVDYSKLPLLTIQAMKEQQAQINSQSEKIESQSQQIAEQLATSENLQKQVDDQREFIRAQQQKIDQQQSQLDRQQSEIDQLKAILCSQNKSAQVCQEEKP
jgi:hypothetical protein